jgi:alkanesulfonate monooxygenase SsuD/methylene tetrahydromethanopterin reductase-like flavin-dependent oxidoreductase (luciferase family)
MREGEVTWSGSMRAALQGQRIYPTTELGSLKSWVGVGGSPESVVRAAHYGLPLVLAIIGGDPRRFVPYVDLYRRALSEFGHGALPIAVHSPGYVAESDDQAREELWPYFKEGRDRIGASRGWPPMTKAQFDQEASADGSLYVGSAETVAAKIARTVALLDIDRFDLKYSSGRLPHQKLMRNIELYGTEVAPMVRERLTEESELLAG